MFWMWLFELTCMYMGAFMIIKILNVNTFLNIRVWDAQSDFSWATYLAKKNKQTIAKIYALAMVQNIILKVQFCIYKFTSTFLPALLALPWWQMSALVVVEYRLYQVLANDITNRQCEKPSPPGLPDFSRYNIPKL
jgi:hypothetical protein